MKKQIIVFLTLILTENLLAQSYSSSDSIWHEIFLITPAFIFVDDNNISGPWDGSELFPYQNIPEGLDSASTGYTVVVKPGFYEILENETVEDSIGLFLFNGVNVKFHKDKELNIAGYLNSAGYHSDSILFTSYYPDSTWSGIRFQNSTFESELRYCKFEKVSGGDTGGAIYIKQASLELNQCSFNNNQATFGAALYCDTLSSVFIQNCQFRNNIASISGGGIHGVMAKSLTIRDCEFQFNQASEGGAVSFVNTVAVVEDNIFTGNEAGNGGALYFDNINSEPLIVTLNTLVSNQAINYGGAFYIQNSDSIFTKQNLITQNSAARGGGIYLDLSNPSVFNNNILSNEATDQGGGLYSINGNAEIYNNILWYNNSPLGNQVIESGANIRYNNIEGGYPGPGNIASYPIFEDTLLPDLHLRYLSPCIDAGDPLSIMDPDTTFSDIGMYYFHHHQIEVLDQPLSISTTVGDSVTFKVNVNWAYQLKWQMSLDNGMNWDDLEDTYYYSKTHVLYTGNVEVQLSNVTIELDSALFRCKFTGPGEIVFSDSAMLRIYPVIRTVAGSAALCTGEVNIPIILQVAKPVKISAFSLTLNYDESLLNYSGYSNLNPLLNDGFFLMNAYAGNLYISWFSIDPVELGNDTLLNIDWIGNQGISHLIWDSISPGAAEFFDPLEYTYDASFSNGEVIQSFAPQIVGQPTETTVYETKDLELNINAYEILLSYQWQQSTDNGMNWYNIIDEYPIYGTNTADLVIYEITQEYDNYQFRCIVSGFCDPADTSDAILVHVLPPPQSVYIPKLNTCAGDILLPLIIQNSDSISAMSLTIEYDDNFMTYNGYQNANDNFSTGYFIINNYNSEIIISWVSLDPIIMTDSLLIELLFTAGSGNSLLNWDTGTPGNCEFSDSNGDFIYTDFYNGSVHTDNCTGTFDLTVYLEGPFNGENMNSDLNELLPSYQPYYLNPWNYIGIEVMSSSWYPDIVDWCLLELRQTNGDASTATTATIIDQQAILIRKDGKCVNKDGISPPHTDVAINDNLYIVIYHRNHLGILSADPIIPVGINYSIDFTTDESNVFGGNLAHKELYPGKWGMIAGDMNADGTIDNNDKIDLWNPWTGFEYYLESDLNLDRQTNNIDKNDYWIPNLGYSTQVPE